MLYNFVTICSSNITDKLSKEGLIFSEPTYLCWVAAVRRQPVNNPYIPGKKSSHCWRDSVQVHGLQWCAEFHRSVFAFMEFHSTLQILHILIFVHLDTKFGG